MDKDHHPSIAIGEEEDDFLKDAFEERQEPPEEKKPIWRKIVIAIIVILLLLLLFWPVSAEQRKIIQRQARMRQINGAGVIGSARYSVISGKPMPELEPGSRSKAIPVGVWFEAENLSNQPELLDYSMVKLVDAGGYESVISRELINTWYEQNGGVSHWGKPVAPGAKVKALAVFNVFRGPVKNYLLRGRDFAWTSDKYAELPIGAFDTIGR